VQKYQIFAQYFSNICRQYLIYGTKIEHNSVKSFLSDSLLGKTFVLEELIDWLLAC